MSRRTARRRTPRGEVARYSLAEVQALIVAGSAGYATSYSVGGRTVEQVPNSYAAYASAAYGSSSVVGACMRVRRDLVSQARFTWREVTDDGTGELKHDDGLAVLDRPWPNGTTGELISKMITDVDLCGNAFVVNAGNRLRWRRPDWMYIVLSGDPLTDHEVDVIGYVYTPGGGGIEEGKPYLVDEVCHWSPIPQPGAEYVGMSWMTSALRDIQGDKAASEHKLNFFANGTQLGPIYTLPATLTAEQFKKFQSDNERAHAGSHNAYKAQYIGGGATVTLAASTFQQLELKATQGANETRIAALAGTHPSIVGLSEGLQGASLNAGNFTAARRLVADITLMRLWQDLCASLQTFVEPPDGYELWIRERAIPFLREDAKDAADIFATEMETVTKGVREGFTPDSAKAATQQRNVLLLEHSGLMSVQLQPPGSGVPGEVPGEVPTEEAPIDFGALRSDARSDRDDDIARALIEAFETIERRFDPDQPRDFHGRWSISASDLLDALTGQDALDAVPTEYRSGPKAHFGDYDGATFTGPEGHGSEQALAEYEGVEYDRTNSYLRNGPLADHPNMAGHVTDVTREADAETAARIAEIDKTMAVSRTTAPVRVERVIKDGRSVFGPAWHEGVMNDSTKDFEEQDREYERWLAGERPDLTGASWLDQGYTSTTANPAFAEAFGERWARAARDMPSTEGEPVIMTITVPEGTGAIQLGDMPPTTEPGDREHSAELMLQRGLTFKVVADHGVDDKGFRRIEVVASHV